MPAVPHRLRPDPGKGVFETMLVADGQPVELDAHLARLAASLKALFGEGLPEGARELTRERTHGIGLGRLRLTVAPDGAGGLATDVATADVDPVLVFPSWERAVGLHSLVVEGGLGAHKWADRELLDEAGGPAGSIPLLFDGEGVVLEASRANVFAVRDRVLRTPPADSRILPGIARERAIQVAGAEGVDVHETELRLDDLLQANEVFLTGSVRGVEPVRSIDGVALPPARELSARIATGLRRRWLG
jgi:para-aminobenzoate synthetase / 4-amino-4-deoxychorismate lyase